MDGYNFTERVRFSLALAREEASRLRHEYVGTEHMLLGIIREGQGVAASVLANLKVDAEVLRDRVLAIVKTGKSDLATGPDLPYTSRAKKVLELAMTEARELGHNYVGTEHVLLGMLREEKGIAAQVLVSAGVSLASARAEMLAILGAATPGKESEERAGNVFVQTIVHSYAPRDTRMLLAVSAALAWLIGLMLIFNPVGFEAPMGIVVDEWTATIAQAQGAVLLGLGAINWLGRHVSDRAALAAILYGNFAVQALSFAIVLRALVRGLIPTAGIGPLVMHVILGALFVWQLRALKRQA
jgi:hypothetical protein